MPGILVLNGGDEFHPGNEPQDTALRDAAGDRPAYIVATAARDNPEAAVRTAQRWFSGLGLDVSELRVRTATEARTAAVANQVEGAGLIYLVGGDPGWVAKVLRGSTVWEAMAQAWREGTALAGSSAGAMALCEWTLVRQSFPGHARRRPQPALGLIPGTAVLPHFDTFGERWIPSAREQLGPDAILLGIDERTAAVHRHGTWSVLGPGGVTVVHSDDRATFSAGSAIQGLPEPG
ncbi:MAG: Type 1 glutamine amidotransferase-like domain-containing protein [Candidatus Dormibacteraeota bacterium]|nr:Type 1 glutamine amidotransferase-like domain-containing protein [Candidatus Dormibacteraeota bacterium]